MSPVSFQLLIVVTSTSYLQTLSPEDASAFVTSLQQVQAHLKSELAWMNQQVQQKTIQLQGVETLLAEASTLGHPKGTAAATASNAVSSSAPAATESTAASTAEVVDQAATAAVDESPVVEHVKANSEASEDTPAQVIAATPSTKDSAQSKGKSTKPSTKSKSRPKTSPKAAATKKSNTAAQSQTKASKAKLQRNSRQPLRPEFADKSLAEAVTQVLAQAIQPLHLNELATAMYGDLTEEDLKRAKISLTNVLSKGKRTGNWRNVGNGLYQIKELPT